MRFLLALALLSLSIPAAADDAADDDLVIVEHQALSGADGVEAAGALEAPLHRPDIQPALTMDQDLFELRSQWLAEMDGLRPGARMMGGGMLGLVGLGALVGSFVGLLEDAYDLRAFGGLALLSGVVAAVGLNLFQEGVKQGRRRRALRRRLRRLDRGLTPVRS